ncbi:MAG: hypothetical protein Q8R18_00585 [bacterium]|nr:hypothetical protein [bacterium]
MNKEEFLRKAEGLQTLDTLVEDFHLRRGSVLNTLSKLKKEGYIQTMGGGKQKRIYKISQKVIPQENGMFTLINHYSKIKLRPSFVHVVHGKYGPENALIDALQEKDFRLLQSSLWLFGHITNWKRLHALAKEKHFEPVIGALYDTARVVLRTRRMPENIYNSLLRKKKKKYIVILPHLQTNDERLLKIQKKWHVIIPLAKADLEDMQ